MADDGYSAGELRRRYGPGGSKPDSELSAAQLRARHNVESRNFEGGGGVNPIVICVVVLAVVAG